MLFVSDFLKKFFFPIIFGQFLELFGFGGTTQQLIGFQSQIFTGNFLAFIPYIIAGLGLLIFIVIGIVDMSIDRNATARSKGKKKVEPRRDYKAPVEEQGNKPVEEFKPNIEEQPQEDEELFVIPKPEEELVTEVEEKTIIRQVVYEKSDLNEVFGS